jgi:uracil-DNA glycosylase family 4
LADFDMLTHIYDRNDLIAMLRWQFEIGIDEALLDFPDTSASPVKLDELLSQINATANFPAKLLVGPITSSSSDKAIKRGPLENGRATDSSAVAARPSSINATDLSNITNLVDLRARLDSLDDCPLKHTASNLCFADGNPGARVMIIGEVPGRDEDRMGVPFVGFAGQLLDKMLASIGLDRVSTYLTNILPWRPPGNRTPTAEEIVMLKPWLFRHVQLVNPDFILLLGGAAAKFVFCSQDGILKLRGKWRDTDFGDGVMRPTLASLHPTYLLRSPAQKRLAFDDLLMLASRLNLPAAENKSG